MCPRPLAARAGAAGPAIRPFGGPRAGRRQARQPAGTCPACPDQARQLLAWAAAWPERTWAVEGATGLGRMLAQQLAAAGEQVLDIQPKLAARVRLLEAGAGAADRGPRRPAASP
jgi:hypothetical protein